MNNLEKANETWLDPFEQFNREIFDRFFLNQDLEEQSDSGCGYDDCQNLNLTE